jgi:hypothetical protein
MRQFSLFLLIATNCLAQDKAAFDPKPYLPLCSTEKVNRDCVVNIDRRYPITLPTYQLHKGSHITVYVFHPFAFEALTLDAGAAQAFESSDQASALVSTLGPLAKNASFGTTLESVMSADTASVERFDLLMRAAPPPIELLQTDAGRLAQEILRELKALNDILTQALQPVSDYAKETKVIYSQIREIESAAPRPVADRQNTVLRGTGVPADTPNPWNEYPKWRERLLQELLQQGNDTTALLARLTGPCQTGAPPTPGPWSAAPRPCRPPNTTTQDSDNPLAIPSGYDSLHQTLVANIGQLPLNQPDAATYQRIQRLKRELDARHDQVAQDLVTANDLLPGVIAKFSTDMETLYANITLARDVPADPVFLGVIPPPVTSNHPTAQDKILVPYSALAPQIVYTVNGQNEIANPLFGLPSAAQKQALLTITALYASPRLEVSSGTFLSWLPNRTFANYTNVGVTGGVPSTASIQIDMTKTTPPLIIPFAAANWRVSPEFTWLGGRRGAVYATAGLGLNPYNTQVEYVAGFSVSWRFLMFSPLFHLGHDTHLTQGEQVGQFWCQNGAGATATSSPPVCGGGPPAPTTKMFWTGAFALGIGVRIPTTFNSTNH